MDTKGLNTKQDDFGWFGGTPMDWKAPYVIQECELSNSALQWLVPGKCHLRVGFPGISSRPYAGNARNHQGFQSNVTWIEILESI